MVHFFQKNKAKRKKHGKPLQLIHNLENKYLNEVLKLKKTITDWNHFFGPHTDDQRMSDWLRIEILGEPLAKKYSWAIPDRKALDIIAHFSPIIEVGAGKGYWSKLLMERDVSIVAYDKFVHNITWVPVKKGGPEILDQTKHSNINLFLCYPDESSQLGIECLEHFKGGYIIHVGELITTGTFNGSSQSPWGRTSSSEFQVELCKSFHCVLQYRIPNFPFANDYLTVWKRSRLVSGDDEDLDNKQQQTGATAEATPFNVDDNNELDLWKDIPPEERLPNVSAPFLQFLLN